MWIEELSIENIKCYEKFSVRLGTNREPYKWVTLLGENGTGKSTFLQALSIALAGPEIANQLVGRPIGWLRDESSNGKISATIHKGEGDSGDRIDLTWGQDQTGRPRMPYCPADTKIVVTPPSHIFPCDPER